MGSSHDLAMAGPPSRRSELLGPRPTPLKIRKDPCRIKKPPAVPPPQLTQQQQQRQRREPIIIYTVSPKVVHTTPGDFMSVVQRLTGGARVPEAPVPQRSRSGGAGAGEAFSPAARLAAFEKAAAAAGQRATSSMKSEEDLLGFDGELAMARKTTAPTVDRWPQTGLFGGILSPGPSSLPWISPSLFTPPSINLFNELSPLHAAGRSFPGMNNFLPITSPNNNIFSSGGAPSPAAGYWDLFNNQYYDS